MRGGQDGGGWIGRIEPADLDDETVAEIEAHSSVRTRRLKLPPRLINLYGASTWPARSQAIIDFNLGVILLTAIGATLDWPSAPPDVALEMFACRIAVALGYIGAIIGLRSPRTCGSEGLLVIAPAVFMILMAGLGGVLGGPVILERLLLNTMFAVGVCILLASIAPRDTAILVGLTVVLFALFVGTSPGHSAIEKVQLISFYGIGAVALGEARLIANKIQQKLFVLDLSHRVTVRKISELNARLHDAARTDPLTGIGNRRVFDEAFQQAGFQAGEAVACVCLIDIDHFKRLNDVLGHGRGDDCLRAVAAALKAAAPRDGDVVARIGGEEFAVLLPATRLEEGVLIADRLRQAVHDLDLQNPSALWRRVTVSIGVAATSQAAAGDLMRCADEALYRAKTLGRDRVVAYETLAFADAEASSAA